MTQMTVDLLKATLPKALQGNATQELADHINAIALDQEEFISSFLNGRGQPGMGPIPPGIFGHLPGQAGINPVVYTWKDGAPQRRSLDEARALLAQAGWDNGRDARTGQPLVLNLDTTSGGLGDKATMDWMSRDLGQLGIRLVLRSTDFNRYQKKKAGTSGPVS